MCRTILLQALTQTNNNLLGISHEDSKFWVNFLLSRRRTRRFIYRVANADLVGVRRSLQIQTLLFPHVDL